MCNVPLPDDFPRDGPFYAIGGNQPKFVARKIGDQFVVGWTEEELCERHECCEDLAHQLVVYANRKSEENPEWTNVLIVERISEGLAKKANSEGWGITFEERTWIMSRVKALLNW